MCELFVLRLSHTILCKLTAINVIDVNKKEKSGESRWKSLRGLVKSLFFALTEKDHYRKLSELYTHSSHSRWRLQTSCTNSHHHWSTRIKVYVLDFVRVATNKHRPSIFRVITYALFAHSYTYLNTKRKIFHLSLSLMYFLCSYFYCKRLSWLYDVIASVSQHKYRKFSVCVAFFSIVDCALFLPNSYRVGISRSLSTVDTHLYFLLLDK